jgi:hypothetical protein
VLDVLSFSDRDVKRKLLARVGAARRPLLVTAVRQTKHMSPVERREPFASLERELGDLLEMVVVADEGTVEGMWRDPVGDLADALFPGDRRRAYAAASGYLLLQGGEVLATVKKRGAKEDAWFLQEALARAVAGVPPPAASARPGQRRRASVEEEPDAGPERSPPPARRRPPPADPWAVLGLSRGASLADAKKAFRALVTQYHPDKVAHLAPEFRELAELRTRQILAAWEAVRAELE